MKNAPKIILVLSIVFLAVFSVRMLLVSNSPKSNNRKFILSEQKEEKADQKEKKSSAKEVDDLPAVSNSENINQKVEVPILMYHHVGAYLGEASDSLASLYVSPKTFDQQMAYLRDNGYETISLADYFKATKGEGSLPPKPIIITFDDGYEDNYSWAFFTLLKYDLKATFFVISGDVNSPGYLNWDQLDAMQKAGMTIGAHTLDHANLAHTSLALAKKEIKQSKADLEKNLGGTISCFAYPYGGYTSSTISLLQVEGFEGAVTTHAGIANGSYNNFELPRKRVSGQYSSSGGINYFVSLLKK